MCFLWHSFISHSLVPPCVYPVRTTTMKKVAGPQPPKKIPLQGKQAPTAARQQSNNPHGFGKHANGWGHNKKNNNMAATSQGPPSYEEIEEEWEAADEAAAEEEREEEEAIEELVEKVEQGDMLEEGDELAVAVPAEARQNADMIEQLLKAINRLTDNQDLYYAQKKGGVTNRFAGDRHTVSRNVHIEFLASMEEFQNNSLMNLWQPPGAQMWMDGKVGDPSSVLLHSLAVTRTSNPFPVQIGVDFEFLRVKGKHTNGGEVRHLILHANEVGRDYNPPMYILEPNEITAGNFLQEHPDFHPDTVWEKGIMYNAGEEYHLVRDNHPVMGWIGSFEAGVQWADSSPATITIEGKTYYSVPNNVFFFAMEKLKEDSSAMLPIYDLNSFRAKLFPDGDQWIQPYIASLDAASLLIETGTKKSLIIEATATYSFMGSKAR